MRSQERLRLFSIFTVLTAMTACSSWSLHMICESLGAGLVASILSVGQLLARIEEAVLMKAYLIDWSIRARRHGPECQSAASRISLRQA